ncbi:MAG: hypothetical protein P8N52_01420 [Crocinitomicaceae bacterium]|nr:hypothetical protein [Crocinitomicaceae bacterium]MDG1776833.1 hypothetical protein [Crocinitomicaceae bacterium]
MKFKLTIAILLGMFFVCCENSSDKLIDMSDVMGSSERYKEGSHVAVESEVDSTLIPESWFVSQGIPVTSLQFRSDRMFLDRFGEKSKDKYRLITSADTILYSKWVYEDSLKVMNAFTNWINCIGDNCSTLFFGEQKNIQENPLQILINDSTLIFIEGSNQIDFKHWAFVLGNLEGSWNYSIEQSRKSKTRWYSFVEGKRKKLEL